MLSGRNLDSAVEIFEKLRYPQARDVMMTMATKIYQFRNNMRLGFWRKERVMGEAEKEAQALIQ